MNNDKPRKFIVSMAIEGRLDVEVEATSAEEAFAKSTEAFMDADLEKMEFIDANAVNAYDVENDSYTDK